LRLRSTAEFPNYSWFDANLRNFGAWEITSDTGQSDGWPPTAPVVLVRTPGTNDLV
jgi:hypothetical protein